MCTLMFIAELFTINDMEAIQMFSNGWMDKEVVVHIYNGILPSHKKGMKLSQL